MFSMFFGAGNIVFPLEIGHEAAGSVLWAVLGLMASAILVPFTGLMAMVLFDGNYKDFFYRLGKIPGFIVICLLMIIIGPGGAIPRCIALSYSSLNTYIPDLSLWIFSLLSCLVIILFTIRPGKILDLLGYILTPFLIITLLVIVTVGLVVALPLPSAVMSKEGAFILGLIKGYYTLDLIGAFFFAHVVLMCLHKEVDPEVERDFRKLLMMTFRASLIGAFLLGAVYVGFCLLAAYHNDLLVNVPSEKMLGAITQEVLGKASGIITCLAVALACLTTAIALTSVFAEFLEQEIFQKKISYLSALLLTLLATFAISTLEFQGIKETLSPILILCYPSLIVLSVVNILHKIYGFTWVRTPVALTLIITLIWNSTKVF